MAFASSAQAGITIPAGDWTVDIGGNVNAFYSNNDAKVSQSLGGVDVPLRQAQDTSSIGTGLLPAQFGIGAKTRQNDLDIAFQFSFFTGTSAGGNALSSNAPINVRQAYLTFGDASWGTIKLGRDLGIFASDAILNDMTLLGVGNGNPGGSSTLGRIGSGYIYADWKGQIAYTSPNWNGFQFTGAVVEGWQNGAAGSNGNNLGYEGKASYDFAANDVSGRVWVSGLTKKHEGDTIANGTFGSFNVNGVNAYNAYTSTGLDIGAKLSYQGATLVGYYYDGRGLDSQNNGAAGGLQFLDGEKTKDSGGYVQLTYAIPGIGTKLGASWGVNNSKSNDGNPATNANNFDLENETWIIGAYHPLTKSLNLVAEYAQQEIKSNGNFIGVPATAWSQKTENDKISLGAILFF